MLKDQTDKLIETIRAHNSRLIKDEDLFNIFEGDVLTYVKQALIAQLSIQSYEAAKHRISPINILRKLVLKLSKIYPESPRRTTELESDQELYDFYIKELDLDNVMNNSNELFNFQKRSLLQPILKDGKPHVRVIPGQRFIVLGEDPQDPMKITKIIILVGEGDKETEEGLKKVNHYFVYTDTEFLPIDSDGEVIQNLRVEGDLHGFSKLPFVYINKSRNKLTPIMDTDLFQMAINIPLLLTDLNFATMFQSFSIVYGIDLDLGDMVMSPNKVWDLKSDDALGSNPKLGTIKPDVDIEKVLKLIETELSMWFDSRNLKPGTTSINSTRRLESGVAMLIENVDTSEDRKNQIQIYKKAEKDLIHLIAKELHPVWSITEDWEGPKNLFTNEFEASVHFIEPQMFLTREQKIKNVKEEMNLGLMSRSTAKKELSPDLTEEEIDLELKKVDDENTFVEPSEQEVE